MVMRVSLGAPRSRKTETSNSVDIETVRPKLWRDRPLLQGINRQAAKQLGIEIGRFLRQHFAGKSDVAYLRHTHRIHQERNIRRTAPHPLDRLRGVTDITQILLLPD